MGIPILCNIVQTHFSLVSTTKNLGHNTTNNHKMTLKGRTHTSWGLPSALHGHHSSGFPALSFSLPYIPDLALEKAATRNLHGLRHT